MVEDMRKLEEKEAIFRAKEYFAYIDEINAKQRNQTEKQSEERWARLHQGKRLDGGLTDK